MGVDGVLKKAFASHDVTLLDCRKGCGMDQLRALNLGHWNNRHLVTALCGTGENKVVLRSEACGVKGQSFAKKTFRFGAVAACEMAVAPVVQRSGRLRRKADRNLVKAVRLGPFLVAVRNHGFQTIPLEGLVGWRDFVELGFSTIPLVRTDQSVCKFNTIIVCRAFHLKDVGP